MVTQAAPFLNVTNIEDSLRFYLDGLGFALTNHWSPEGRIRWCWIEPDRVAVMPQEYWRDGRQAGAPEGPLGQGVSICLVCEDTRDVRD
jgi:lactoylglutathione lyase